MANSRTPAELKNCKLENPSPLFWPLAQYLGRDKRRALSTCATLFCPIQFQEPITHKVSIHSFIHTEHLYSASSRELLRGTPDSSAAKKSSLKLRKKRR